MRQAWPKRLPRGKKVRNPGESKTRAILAARSGGRCERCSAPAESVHHRLKRGQGGPWSPSNCVAVCGDGVRACHGWCERHPNAARAQGFHVRPWETPAEVALLYRGRWVLLGDDGSVVPAGGES